MPRPPAIVVGVDGVSSDTAVDWAAAHAARSGAALHLVHALPPMAAVPVPPGDDPYRRAGRAMLADAAARTAAAGASACTTACISLPPGPGLVAASETAGIVVLGSRGGGARLGTSDTSVGAHVSRFARCSVALVPDAPRAATGMVGMDLQYGADAVVRFTVSYATLHGLTVQTVRPVRATALAGIAPGTAGAGATPRPIFSDVDLVVLPAPLPAHSAWGARGRLDQIAIRHSGCPVVFAR